MQFSENPVLATIITLSYNSPDLLGAIDSVLEQNYPRIEYVLVDDCSPAFPREDITNYIAQNNKGNLEKIQVLRNDKNYGVTYSFNLAIRNSSGKYIFNLAGDDQFADANVISDWVKAFEETGSLIMTAYCDRYDETLKTRLMRFPEEYQVKMIKRDSPQELFEKISVENFIFGCCTARSRACIEKYGFYNECYRMIEDHPMNLFLLRHGQKIAFFDRVVVKYRGGGISAVNHFNPIYEQEADSILRNEALPYSRNPQKLWKKYLVWKKRQTQRKKFEAKLSVARGPRARFFLRAQNWVRHPIRTVCNVIRHPKRILGIFKA